jgi:hypothetical protein
MLSSKGGTMDVIKWIRNLQETEFYGALELVFQRGRVVLLKQTQSFKPGLPGETERSVKCQNSTRLDNLSQM